MYWLAMFDGAGVYEVYMYRRIKRQMEEKEIGWKTK